MRLPGHRFARVVAAGLVAGGSAGCNSLFDLDPTSLGADTGPGPRPGPVPDAGGAADGSAVDPPVTPDASDGSSSRCQLQAGTAILHLCTGFDGSPYDLGLIRRISNGTVERATPADAPTAPASMRTALAGGLSGGVALAYAPIVLERDPLVGELQAHIHVEAGCLAEVTPQGGHQLLSMVILDRDSRMPRYTVGVELATTKARLFEARPSGSGSDGDDLHLPGDHDRRTRDLAPLSRGAWHAIRLSVDLDAGTVYASVGAHDETWNLDLTPNDAGELQVEVGQVAVGLHGPCAVHYDDVTVLEQAR